MPSKRGQLVLQAILDTKKAEADFRALVGIVQKGNNGVERDSARSLRVQANLQTALTREATKQIEIRTRAEARSRADLERARTQEARTLVQLNRAEQIRTKAILDAAKAVDGLAKSEERANKARQPQRSGFAQAIYTSRYSVPGTNAQPLVGRTLSAAGMDLKKPLTVAAGVGLLAGGAVLSASVAASQKAIEFFEDATQKAGDLNEEINKSQQIFKDSSGEIENWAKDAAKNLALTQREAIGAASSFGNLLQSADMSASQAAKASEELVKRATDLSSLFNTDISEALQNIQSGLAGEMEPLRKYGIFLTEAAVKAKAWEMGLGEVKETSEKTARAQTALNIATAEAQRAVQKYGEGSIEAARANARMEKATDALTKAQGTNHRELTQGEKIQARYALLMDQSKVAAGDFARTAGEAANAQRRLKAETDELITKIGKDLLPLKKDFLAFFSDAIDVSGDLYDGLKLLANQIAKWDADNWGMGSGIQWAIDHMKTLLSMIRETIHLNVQTAKNDATDQGQAANTNQDLQLFKAKRASLDQVYKIRDADPNDPRINSMVRDIFSDELYKRAESYGVDVQRRNLPGEDYAILDNAIAISQKKYNDLNAKMAAARTPKATQDYSSYYRSGLAVKDTKPAPVKTNPSGTGTGGRSTYYSGADRNAGIKKAAAAAVKRQREQERLLRQAQQASDRLEKTVLRGQVIGFNDTLSTLAKTGTPGTLDALRQSALSQSDAIWKAENADASKIFARDSKKNPQEARLALQNAQLVADQKATERQKAIDKHVEFMNKRLEAAKVKEAKAAEQRAENERVTFEDVQEYNERVRESYREFLSAEHESLQYAQEMAKQRGDFAKANELALADMDNAVRQILAQYDVDVQAAAGNADALKTAQMRRDLGFDQTIQTKNREISSNILGSAGDTIRYGTNNAISQLFQNEATGKGNTLGNLEEAFANLGETAGDSFAQYAQRRFVDGPLAKFFDDQAAKLAGGGADAGRNIAIGASALAQVASLFAQQNSKKRSGGIFGGILGGIAGFLIGGPAGALTGFSAGAQAGQGNWLGAALTVGIGSLRTGGIKLNSGGGVGAKPYGPAFANGGFPIPNMKSLVGERGFELAFSAGGVSALGLDGMAEYRPSGQSVVLPHETSRKLVAAAANMAGNGNNGPTVVDSGIVNNFYGDVNDGSDVEIIDKQQQRRRELQALVH